MNVWAISDLHLSFARPDRRERFAARWADHAAKIAQNWRQIVGASDVVLIPGDLSMAGNHRELQPDLAWLHRLPGTKVLAPGNHDRWWNNVTSIRRLLRSSLLAVDGDALATHGLVVSGMAGAPVPGVDTAPADRPGIDDQMRRLEHALEQAGRIRADPTMSLYVLWHYPPFDAHGRPGPWVERFEQAGITACIYGHLHNQSEWPAAVQGIRNGVHYHCVAADAIGFRPLLIGRVSDTPSKVD